MTEAPWLIVGLGNPGSEYDNTLHNIGRDTVQALAARTQSNLRQHRSGTMFATAHFGVGTSNSVPVLLAVSRSYMNISGPPFVNLMNTFKIPIERLLVVHDDLDLDAHVLRLKKGGGEGGHNGLRSLTGALKSKEYARLRVGIGRPPGTQDAAKYVLSPIPKSRREDWGVTVQLAADTAESVVLRGFTATQMELHTQG